MHVVGVAVVGEVHGDDGFELRRAAGGDLQGVEAAPRFAKEADVAGAPGLVGDPGQHGQGVVLLLGQVFVVQDAVGLAAAAHVHADGGVAVSGEVGVALGVAHGRSVPFAIRQIFQQGRNRVDLGVYGQPDARRQPRPVRQGNPGVFNLADGVREGAFNLGHNCPFATILPRVIESAVAFAR